MAAGMCARCNEPLGPRKMRYCRECKAAYARETYVHHPRPKKPAWKRTPEQTKAALIKCRYGLTVEELNILEEKQNHRCAICGRKKKLYIDHDHKTGRVRGLLCQACNSAIGLLQDSNELLSSAIEYLRYT